ncbi:hypothetical protein [Streptomyces sp. NPDC048411]|uniref:hypothetical protein n=1 Tax=Streptomyces sp. NPDC048411 TaxID=3157206 RepID=UPI003453812D
MTGSHQMAPPRRGGLRAAGRGRATLGQSSANNPSAPASSEPTTVPADVARAADDDLCAKLSYG